MGRIYAIGDIHGHYELLKKLIKKIHPAKDDLLVFLGDYIDRGNKSREVIDYLKILEKKYHCVFLKGNHEDMVDKALHGDDEMLMVWLYNGGIATLEEYGSKDAILDSMEDFIGHLQLYYETPDYLFVHAGVIPNRDLSNQREKDILWIRDSFISKPTNLPKKVVFGHTPALNPIVMKDKIGIDTGAGHGGPLTALKLPEEEMITIYPS